MAQLSPPSPATAPGPRKVPRRRGDTVFASLAVGAGIVILLALAGVAIFLLIEGLPAITGDQAEIAGGKGFWRFVGPVLFGTIWAAVLALIVATPLAIGIALFISHYAPRRLASGLGYIVDLLAAVPSVVFGLWGIFIFAPYLVPIYSWLGENLSFIPLFAGPASGSGRTIGTAALVLAVMILPIMTAVCREVFLQTPRLHEEAALAMGATRWEMIRMAVLPYGRSGVISAGMLGLGRALGETVAVALILSVSRGSVTTNLISTQNPSTIAANIALDFPESTGIDVNVLIASGLVLFLLTFVVNYLARAIAARQFSGAAG
ncbi:MAG: phosphate ABC transporter permease subunit PstC [Gemmatimonadota bacterium]|nr:phosphate ABC transporter permease subunit PstC [Gemmatimonadota bacterium]